MINNRDRFPVYVVLSLFLHAAGLVFLTMLPPQRAVTAQETAQRFVLLPLGLDSGLTPGGAPLGEPAPAPPGKPARKVASARIAHTAQSEPAPSPTETPREHLERPPALTSTAPIELAPGSMQPATTDNGTGHGGSETGLPGGTGTGGNGEGGSPDGCIGCKGGQRGRGSGIGRVSDWKAEYKRKVFSRIQSVKQYPYAARRAGMEGRVVVKFTITRAGAVSGLSVVTPSPYPILNSDALEWVQRACPFPPFPAEAEESTIVFTYGLRYELTE